MDFDEALEELTPEMAGWKQAVLEDTIARLYAAGFEIVGPDDSPWLAKKED